MCNDITIKLDSSESNSELKSVSFDSIKTSTEVDVKRAIHFMEIAIEMVNKRLKD